MPLRQPALPAHDARAEAVSPGELARHWDAESLRQSLLPWLPRISVEVVQRCASTNTELIERARRACGELEPCLLVAEQQTMGRGRLGRGWVSAAGASLTFSLALPLAPRDWSGLSLAVGLAIAEALDVPPSPHAPHAPQIMLKWPNDLWLADLSDPSGATSPAAGRKLGGVLVETLSAGPSRLCVIGVGLNVLPLPQEAHAGAAGFASGYACLHEVQPLRRAPEVLAAVAPALARALRTFEADGFAPRVAAYAARDLLRGLAVSTSLPQWPAGVAEGVDETGALMLSVGGQRQRIVSGEVSVRPAGREAQVPQARESATRGAAAP